MVDVVLVPGGWSGGWAFASIAREMRARGHEVFTPEDGQSWWDLAGDDYRQLVLDRSRVDGLAVSAPPNIWTRGVHPIRWQRSARPFG